MFDRKHAPTDSPKLGFRFRTKTEVLKIKRAAKAEGVSLNTFVVASASMYADQILASMASQGEQQRSTDSVPQ
jgi:uncharacterized protein (DUF1778 family)